jgi:hypothetical protein
VDCGSVFGFARPIRADHFPDAFQLALREEHLDLDSFDWHIGRAEKTVRVVRELCEEQAVMLSATKKLLVAEG